MEIIKTEKLPIANWCENIEEAALQQAKNLANNPFVTGRVCIMPDGHCGFGIPIGGVVLTKDAVIPNAVGVDIGCSMTACKTDIKIGQISKQTIHEITDEISSVIPVGFAHRSTIHPLVKENILFTDSQQLENCPVCTEEKESAMYQAGTLGGGNHFIEIQTDGEHICIMIHTGSRNLGKKVCDRYNNIAKELCEAWKHEELIKQDLAVLPKIEPSFDAYMREMEYCKQFAKLNHTVIAAEIEKILHDCGAKITEMLFTSHNFAEVCKEYKKSGKNTYILHRKGAVNASAGKKVIIPGSQGTASYICEGLGNKHSYCSASHGAGRKMSRTQAKETLDLAEVQAHMDALGIYHNIKTKDQLDEAAAAYKDIEDVLSLESDLVKPLVKLTPLAVIKG